ncbi:F-box and WD repeat domain containing protein 10B [Rhinophrynus dorsalis]
MKESEYRLACAPNLRCENQSSKVPLCQVCQTCVLSKKVAVTKEWFLRAGEMSQRKLLLGIIRRMRSLDVLEYAEQVLRPVQGKDFTYTRSRTHPSLDEDLVTSSSDRALDRHLLEQFMVETWEWFKRGSYWTKANYAVQLFRMCSTHLLHSAANLVHVLKIREMGSCSTDAGTRNQQDKNDGDNDLRGTKEPDQEVSADDPCLMVIPSSFKSTSGVSKYKDFISCLPVHLSKRILGLLNNKTLYSCLFVSQHWCYLTKDLLQDLEAERTVQKEAMILQGTSYRGVSVSYAKIKQVPIPKVGGDGNMIPATEKKFYEESATGQCLDAAYTDIETDNVSLEERNLFCGSYNILILTAQLDHHRVMHFDEGKLVAVGSSDRKVKFLDSEEMKQVPPLIQGHAGSIRAVRLCERRGFVFSASYDLSIRQWDVKTGLCMKIFHGHMKTITCLDVQDDILVSGAKDCHVKVWDMTTGKCLKTFKHQDTVLCVKIKGEIVVSGCEKGLVKVWRVKSATLIKTLTGHQGPIKCLSFDQCHLVSGSADGSAIAWSMVGNFSKSLMTFRHPKEVTCLEFLYLRVVTGCADGKIRIFNFLNGECIRVIRANSRVDPVLSLCISDNRMVINAPTSIMVFQFENISWDYSQASGQVNVLKERDKFRSAPIRTQPYSYVRAQRMKRIGSSDRKLYRQEDEENVENRNTLTHHARSLSARSIRRAQDLHLDSLKPIPWPDLRNIRRSFAYIDLQPEFIRKSPSAGRPRAATTSSTGAVSRKSAAPERQKTEDSDTESRSVSPGRKSALSISEEATLQRMRKRGPHTPMTTDQMLLKVNAIHQSQKSNELGSNMEYNMRLRDVWGPPQTHQEHKRFVQPPQSRESQHEDPVTLLQQIKSSARPVEMTAVVTPFEVRKLALKRTETLHRSDIQSSIPSPTVVRPQTSDRYSKNKTTVAGLRRSASAVESAVQKTGKFTSCETVQPLRMIMRPNNNVTCQKSIMPEQVVSRNPFREKGELILLTVQQQEEYEAEKMSQYNKAEAQVQAGEDRERRKTWLMKVQGKNIADFTKEGRIAAPELGLNVFI